MDKSPSSRRAWIEIDPGVTLLYALAVALLAEGVDRNVNSPRQQPVKDRSPSSRRAWIEIPLTAARPVLPQVALLAEGVDRNRCRSALAGEWVSRPPRGGRG